MTGNEVGPSANTKMNVHTNIHFEDPSRMSCVLVFPGQGCQRVGMGQEFFQCYPECRETFERASDAIEVDMAELCFSPNELLDLTEYTQPAILTVEVAIAAALQAHFGFEPEYFAGHSLGEYTALVVAGVLALEDAVRIVRDRGARMQAAASQNKGAMSAIIFDEIPYSEVERICNLTGCEIANYNSPAQAVISGAKEAVREAEQILQTAYPQVRMVALNVSAPFHSRSMEPIEKGFSQFLQSFVGRFKMEKVTRVLSNYSGQFHSPQNLVTALVKQISGPVRWIENMRVLARSSMPIYEIGPQRVLAKFFSSIGISVQSITDLRSLDRLTRSNSPHGA